METRLEITNDGSNTIFVPDLNEHYHSTFGAIQESLHVFIRSGFDEAIKVPGTVSILEVGFGTGLNALLTRIRAKETDRKVRYTAVEKYPLQADLYEKLNYSGCLELASDTLFRSLHTSEWNQVVSLPGDFLLHKYKGDIRESEFAPSEFDLVYFDAFGPQVQPELWTENVFRRISPSVRNGGIFVTYSSRGAVRRALKSSGFEVEKIPGPPGKREITRATKI